MVIKLDEIGDMVYAIPVFDYLKSQFPNAKINLLCKPFVKPLVEHHPAISTIIHEIPKNEKFDLIVELRGNWDTLKYSILNMPNLRFDRGSVRIKNKWKGSQKHEVTTNFEIIEPLLARDFELKNPKIYMDEESKTFVSDFILKNQLTHFAVIHCGARRVLRQWPAHNFAALILILKEKYKLQIVFAGTEEDELVIDEIIRLSKTEAIICTRNFSLLHFAALVEKAKLFIGNESGPLHIAAAMDTPLVGIYGPGVPNVFYPIGSKSKVVHHVLDCNPCDQVHCVRPENPCINLATVLEVEEKISEILCV
ncbi:MAG: glycosyltransferase family 9 protein [Bacteroidia bacterium]